jgi:cobalt-zinc-cadmium efflux system membrane fusion protein
VRLLAVIAFLALAGCARHSEPSATRAEAATPRNAGGASGPLRFAPDSPQLRQIRVEPATSVEVPLAEVVAPGRLQIDPNRISRLAMPVPGRVASVAVRLGDSVKQGQALLAIESPEVEAAVSEAYRADAVHNQARAELDKARADLSRISDLFEHGAAPKKDVLNAEAELARAQSGLEESAAAVEQARRRLAIFGLKPGEYGQRVMVRAPISGKVLEINVVPGEYRNDTSSPLMTIAALSTLWVASGVPENSIRWIQAGERVIIGMPAFPGEVFLGRVMRIADTVDPQTRVVEVWTELANPDGRFRPEMYARIRHSHGSKTVAAVPSSAIIQSSGRSWVFLAKAPGEFLKLPVEIGEAAGPTIPVLSGVRPGDRVVVEGAILLAGQAGGQP